MNENFLTISTRYRNTYIELKDGRDTLVDLIERTGFNSCGEDAQLKTARDVVAWIIQRCLSQTHPKNSIEAMLLALLNEPVYREKPITEQEEI